MCGEATSGEGTTPTGLGGTGTTHGTTRERLHLTREEELAAHVRKVTRKREVIAAIRRHAQYIPDWNYIARALRDQEHMYGRTKRSIGDLALALSNTWMRRRYYESDDALTEWRFRS